ncbi:hypothetical protein [Winogradskyella aurantiaca]|uniref:hypothetical protein n=1 Tax=Winogradskyella aurantiaca TaxID=2219558 RepID=UPI000E1D4D52|nr:hypothetical protein [Winogradskyella aurantiaca]
MLDLRKLEEKLDKALSLETEESLTNWLKEKRLKKFLSSFGEGELCQISNEESIKVTVSNSFNFEIEVNSFDTSYNPKLAA